MKLVSLFKLFITFRGGNIWKEKEIYSKYVNQANWREPLWEKLYKPQLSTTGTILTRIEYNRSYTNLNWEQQELYWPELSTIGAAGGGLVRISCSTGIKSRTILMILSTTGLRTVSGVTCCSVLLKSSPEYFSSGPGSLFTSLLLYVKEKRINCI